MDAIAVALPAAAGEGDAVTLVGDGVLIEEHASALRHDSLRDRLRDRLAGNEIGARVRR